MTADRLLCFQFFRFSVNGKQLMRFRSEKAVFKFLRRSVDAALEIDLRIKRFRISGNDRV